MQQRPNQPYRTAPRTPRPAPTPEPAAAPTPEPAPAPAAATHPATTAPPGAPDLVVNTDEQPVLDLLHNEPHFPQGHEELTKGFADLAEAIVAGVPEHPERLDALKKLYWSMRAAGRAINPPT